MRGSGFLVWMTRVVASGASTLSIVVKTVLTRVFTLGSQVRSRLHLASAAVKGSPLCHFTPWRILNVQVVGLVSFHSVASPGCSLPSAWRATRLSNRLNEIRMSLADVEKCGSNFEMSPPWATTSSRFCVVCAWAGAASPGATAAAAPATAADFRSSRRVSSLIGHLVLTGGQGPPRYLFRREGAPILDRLGV